METGSCDGAGIPKTMTPETQTLIAALVYLYGVLCLILLCVPIQEDKPKRKGKITALHIMEGWQCASDGTEGES